MDRFYVDRWDKIQPPSRSEFDRVTMYKFAITEASAKINATPGPYPDYLNVPVWAGIVPVEMRMGEPFLDPAVDPATILPQDFSNIEFVTGKRLNEAKAGDAGNAAGKPLATLPVKLATGAPPRFYQAPLGGKVTTMFSLANGEIMSVSATAGESLMEAAKAADVPGIVGECCGSMVCATCHVAVADDWIAKIKAPSGAEVEMLEFVEGGRVAGSRLSCQIVVTEGMDGLTVQVPDQQR
jgi:2Fe-2S ferredoxin